MPKSGDIYSELRELISNATETIWKKLQGGDITIVCERDNPDAYWMSHYTSHISTIYLNEWSAVQILNQKKYLLRKLKIQKDHCANHSKYSGSRFEEFDSTHSDSMEQRFIEPTPTFDELRKLLVGKEAKTEVIAVLLLRAGGEKYKEIG